MRYQTQKVAYDLAERFTMRLSPTWGWLGALGIAIAVSHGVNYWFNKPVGSK